MNNPEGALNQLTGLLEEKHNSFSIETITDSLGRHSFAMILLLFSLPFSFPITIPGFSTPFGLALLFLGLRFTVNKPLWLPEKIRKQHIKKKHLSKFVKILDKFLKKTRKIIKPRLLFVFKTPLITGILICLQSCLMAMPIPLPFTNVFACVPLVLLGLGLLAGDGLFIVLGYISSLISITFFIALFWFGIEGLERISPF